MSVASTVRRLLKQKLVYWAHTGSDQYGRPSFEGATPQEVACRWDDVETEVLATDGRKLISKAKIIVQSPAAPQGIVMKTTLEAYKVALFYPLVPTVNQGGFEVLRVNEVPDSRGRTAAYILYC